MATDSVGVVRFKKAMSAIRDSITVSSVMPCDGLTVKAGKALSEINRCCVRRIFYSRHDMFD